MKNALTPQCISFLFIWLAASWLLPINVTASGSSEIEMGCPGETANIKELVPNSSWTGHADATNLEVKRTLEVNMLIDNPENYSPFWLQKILHQELVGVLIIGLKPTFEKYTPPEFLYVTNYRRKPLNHLTYLNVDFTLPKSMSKFHFLTEKKLNKNNEIFYRSNLTKLRMENVMQNLREVLTSRWEGERTPSNFWRSRECIISWSSRKLLKNFLAGDVKW